MKKNTLKSLLPMVICAAMFVGCGEKETAVESTESVVTETVAEATEEVTATEEIIATEEIAEETETEEVVEETETETEQSTETTKSNKKDKTKASSESTETAAASVQEETTASFVETASSVNESTATSSSDTSNTPSNETPSNDTASSGEIVYNGSLNLHSLGITIVYPNQYVSSGFSSNHILNNANAFTDAANKTLGDAQGMTWFGNAYGFYVLGYNSTPQSQIKYNGDGTYTLIIGSHFGGGYQSLLNYHDISAMNADVILCELATMSSAPQSVYNGIYDILYGTTIYDANTWYTFGDCKVSYSPEGNDDPMDATLYLKKA